MTEQHLLSGVIGVSLVVGTWQPPDSADLNAEAVIKQAMAGLQDAQLRATRKLFRVTLPLNESRLRAVAAAAVLESHFQRDASCITDMVRGAVAQLVADWPQVCQRTLAVSEDSRAWLPSADELEKLLCVELQFELLVEQRL